jgi:hypothetical protein
VHHTSISTLSSRSSDDLTRDRLSADGPYLDDLRVGDLDAAGWGASWQPDSRLRLPRSDPNDWADPPDPQACPDAGGQAVASTVGRGRWTILGRIFHPRRLLVDP